MWPPFFYCQSGNYLKFQKNWQKRSKIVSKVMCMFFSCFAWTCARALPHTCLIISGDQTWHVLKVWWRSGFEKVVLLLHTRRQTDEQTQLNFIIDTVQHTINLHVNILIALLTSMKSLTKKEKGFISLNKSNDRF